jgi:hypothetical protein
MKARLTILQVMGAVAFAVVGMAALRTNDELWAAVILALTVFTLCTAALFAMYRRGAWAGFAVFGWAITLPMAMAYRIFFHVGNPAQFPTVSFQIPGYPAIMADGDGEPFLAAVSGGWAGFRGPVPVNSLRAGLCLTTILVGFVGAIVGGFIVRRCGARSDSRDDDRPRLSTPP